MRFRFRDVELDPARFELTRAGEPVRLEPQAFEVLAHLIQHRDRVVTRDELLEAVWGSVYVSDSALATRIKEARRALGDDGTEQWAIRTIHRRGYRFVQDVAEAPASVPSDLAPPPVDAGGTAGPAPVAATASIATPTASAAPTVPMQPASVAVPVGREPEFARLRELQEEAAASGTRVVFISGEAGIGKSTLIDRFLHTLRDRDDVLVARGHCIEGHGTAEAYLPLLDAIGQLISGPQGSVAAQALRHEAPTWVIQLPGLADGPPGAAEAFLTRERMLRELTGALDEMGRERTVVLALEDLHWSDPSTLDALEMLCRRQSDARLLVLATIRTGDTVTGGHPVHGLAAELASRGYATSMRLGPLDETAMRELIAQRAAADPVDASLASLVTARAGGNPLFATSLLEHWRPPHGPASPDGQPSAGEHDLPETLRQLVTRQLEHVTDGDRQILEAAAVAGETLTPYVAATICGRELEEVEETLDRCVRHGQFLRRRGVFEWPDGGLEDEYEFTHSLIRETTLSNIPLGRRGRMHRAAGGALAGRLGTRAQQHIDEIAAHFVRGGDAARAVPALIQSARRARSRSAQREARQALEQALTLVERIPEDAERSRLEVETQTLLGAVAIALDGWASPSIQSAYERALELCRTTEDHALIREILAGLATTHEFRGNYEMSAQLITEQMSLMPQGDTPPESHELLACSLFHQGALRASIEQAEAGLLIARRQALTLYRTAFGEHPATACQTWLAQSRWFLGQVRQARDDIQEALDEAPDDLSRLHAHEHGAMIAQYDGDVVRTREHARSAYTLSRSLGFEASAVISGLFRAWAEVMDGQAQALPALDAAVEAYRNSGVRLDLPYVLALAAEGYLVHGQLERCRRLLDEAFAVREPGRGYVFEPEMWRLRGRLALAQERVPDAVDHFRHAAEAARRQEARTPELRAVTALLELDPADAAAAERALVLLEELGDDGDPAEMARAHTALAAAPR